MSNSLIVIQPYKHLDMWVFDDENTGLVKEPFVDGADDIIDLMVKDIPNAEDGFILIFGLVPFPSHDIELTWSRADSSEGNWYHCKQLDMEGWLCPALFKYFDTAPKKIYAQFKPKAS